MKKIFRILLLAFCMLALTGCNGKISETTMFYSMITAPSEYYIRLEKDGDFVNNAGLNGTYEIKGDKVTFHDEVGSESTGYLIDNTYLLYIAYDGNDNKIPDGDTFDVSVFDGTRTTLTFNADGTMDKYIYWENLYNYQLLGTYERDGDFIKCTIVSKSGAKTVQTYAVHDGVLYEVLSADKNDFSDAAVASISQLKLPVEEEVSVLAVVMIVLMLIVIIGTVVFLIYKLNNNNGSKTNTGHKNKK